MRAWLRLLKARILFLCSAGVVILGLAPLLYLAGFVAWQIHTRLETGSWIALPATLAFYDRALLQSAGVAPLLAFIPHFDWAWSNQEAALQILATLHIGLIPGLVGCAVMAVGISSLLRQRVLIRIHKERKKSQVTRLETYRPEPSAADGRKEPFIGAVDLARDTDRRAA